MIRFVTMTDLHLSAHSPSAWKGDYLSYEAHNVIVLRQIFRYAEKVKASAILCGGDILHRKGTAQNPLSFLLRTAHLFKSCSVPIWTIAGNHDMPRGSISSGLSEPFQALHAMSAFHLLDGAPRLVENKELGPEHCSVEVMGASFDHGRADSFAALESSGADYTMAVGHFGFGPEAGEFFGEPVYGPESFREVGFDVALIGHHHYDQGIRVTDAGKHFMVHGSTAWTSVHPADAGRMPAAGLVEFSAEGITTKILRPKVPEFSELIDLEGHQAQIEETAELEGFIANLGAVEFDAADPVKVLADLETTDEVRARAKTYLEEAEASI